MFTYSYRVYHNLYSLFGLVSQTILGTVSLFLEVYLLETHLGQFGFWGASRLHYFLCWKFFNLHSWSIGFLHRHFRLLVILSQHVEDTPPHLLRSTLQKSSVSVIARLCLWSAIYLRLLLTSYFYKDSYTGIWETMTFMKLSTFESCSSHFLSISFCNFIFYTVAIT